METLPVHVYKQSFGPIIALLDKHGRKIIITTKDDKIIHAEGLTKEELEPILKEAKNLAAIDPNKTGDCEKKT